ncbi:MAG: glycosyltransferase family 2 protein [Candidatus Pacearchaeota archaeon]|jgi:glycosyltransferase involved in cell wall biosynthesis
MKLSVIIPAYNEEKRIEETLRDVNQYLSKKDFSYEMIVVNDGSTDNTKQIVESFCDKIPNMMFIDNKINSGKGSAVKQGMLAASGDYRLFMDADNAIKINHLEKFLAVINDYDLVIGSIELPGSKKWQEYKGLNKIYRNLFGKLSKYLIQVVNLWEIRDTQRAFKLFRKDAAKEIFSRQTIDRWGFDIELLVIAKKLGYKIKELPVEWINPSGRVNFKSFLNTFLELFEIKVNSFSGKYK